MGAGLPAMAVGQSMHRVLTLCCGEQARCCSFHQGSSNGILLISS